MVLSVLKRCLLVFGLFLSLAYPLSSHAAVRRPVIRLEGLTSSIVGIKVDLAPLRGANLRSARLLIERSCDEEAFRAIALMRSPTQVARLYDFPSSNAIECRYRAKFSGKVKRQAVRMVSRVLLVILPDGGVTPPLPIPTSGTTPVPTPRALPTLAPGQTDCSSAEIANVVTRTNYHRSLNGLRALSSFSVLNAAGKAHSIMMGSLNSLTHDGFFFTAQDYGFNGSWLGQNIASTIPTGNAVVDAWMTSDGHRANILSTRAIYIGVGCIKDPTGKVWWSQYFSN